MGPIIEYLPLIIKEIISPSLAKDFYQESFTLTKMKTQMLVYQTNNSIK